MEAVNFSAEFVKDGEKAIPSPPPECWDPTSLLNPVKQINFAPLTGQQIPDFFSLTSRTKTFQDSIKDEMKLDKKWRNRK